MALDTMEPKADATETTPVAQKEAVLELGRRTNSNDGHAKGARVKSLEVKDLQDGEVTKYFDELAGDEETGTLRIDSRGINVDEQFLTDFRLKQKQYGGRLNLVLDGVDTARINEAGAQVEGTTSEVVRSETQMRKDAAEANVEQPQSRYEQITSQSDETLSN